MADEKQFEEELENEIENEVENEVEAKVKMHFERDHESDRLSGISWAFILMWAGFVFLARNMGWFALYGIEVDWMWSFNTFGDFTSFGVWNLIALGAGAILVLETFARILIPQYRRHVGGSLIVAAVFIAVGLGGWFNWAYLWPIILIAVGVNVLLKGLLKR